MLYLDYEMSSADLWERLTELGYNEHTDLQRLHYALLPSLPALDTAEGGQYLYNLAKRLHVDAVVVDTIGRAIEGEENSADTIRAFYRHTAQPLKAAGIACYEPTTPEKTPTKDNEAQVPRMMMSISCTGYNAIRTA